MSQWNNSYAYNNQYQAPNTWNSDMNNQYANQAYYARPDAGNQYVSFNEFLNQMQTNNPAPANAASYNTGQYEGYQARQYSYQNMQPSTSQPQVNSYNYGTAPATPSEVNIYQTNVQSQYNTEPKPSSYTNEMILNSNLTPTATEFVPKCSIKPSASSQNIPEASSSHSNSVKEPQSYQNKTGGSSSDRNWRERPQNSQTSESKEKSVQNGHSNEKSYGNNRNRETYHKNNESNGRHYENVRKYDNNRDYDSGSRNEESSSHNNDSSEPNSHNYESGSRNYGSSNRNREPNSRNNESNARNLESSSQDYESQEPRNQESNSRKQDSNRRTYDRNQESQRNYESSRGDRNYESNRGERYESNRSDRNYDSNRDRNYDTNRDRNFEPRDRRNQKGNSKFKGKDSDNRTFYNSSMPKDSQDVRGRGEDSRGRGEDSRGRGEDSRGRGEGSGRNRNYAGSQRVRIDRNAAEDEQFASNYAQQKEERIERERGERERASRIQNINSPVKYRNKQHGDQVNKEMTQRERLTQQLDKGTLECLVCCERVKQTDSVWACSNCYHVLHLRCIRKWAMSSMVEGKWRCPACQNTNETIPTEYRCMCGAMRSPEYQRGSTGAHTCGKACKRPRFCPHPCVLLCHPGPCPPCQATVNKQCGCGAETRSVLCSSKLPQVCGRVCGRKLECGVHTCGKECHEGPCDTCSETVTQVCYCPAATERTVPCTSDTGEVKHWSCTHACGRVLACGAHVCRAPCHAPPCADCALLPAAVRACPCGKMQLKPDERKSCTDRIPLCGNICAKPLPCGPAGDKHFCKLDCHEGACPECPDNTLVQCRCGHSSRDVPCRDLPQVVLCQKKCNKKLSCGRHRCREICCGAGAHRCGVACGRSLPCGAHRCPELCHTGHCAPCPRVSFDELSCECGARVLLPPVRCGARPPACDAPCRRPRACAHPPHHSCHSGDCPPCVVLTTKRCYGDHEERKTIPCSQEEFSCGLACGKPLPCGRHACIKTCHKGPCDTSKCTQPCAEKRPSCGHPCAAPCHVGAATEPDAEAGAACPSAAPCRRTVRVQCPCGRRHAERSCHENARDYAKLMSALAATKMQEGGSVELSDVQRPGSMLKTLDCDDECRVEARTRQLALALQIRNPDVSAKLAPRYSELLRTTAAREPSFAHQVHDALTDLVQKAKKSKQKTRSHSFPSMNWQKRQFIHELCEHFGCESVAYDAEPNRNVVATADREKSWLPAMSVLEVLAREAGKRRVPGPVLRAPPAASASSTSNATSSGSSTRSSGWATLTSTNAWAARSQPKPQPAPAPALRPPEAKIDYFDNPPDN